jgi:membrane-bound serine protease (ClpP class)
MSLENANSFFTRERSETTPSAKAANTKLAARNSEVYYLRMTQQQRIPLILLTLLAVFNPSFAEEPAKGKTDKPVYIIPVRADIDDSLVYIVRRGVREATAKDAQAIILDMDTNGGKGSSMEKIMDLMAGFKGETITFINNKAFSAGAFISVSTKHIYMSESGVIGAAAPVMVSPSGEAQDLPSTMEKKVSSAFSAMMRAAAQRNGHNPKVVEAMVKMDDGLEIEGKTIKQKGELLTLTSKEATAKYGNPPKALLAEGIVENMDDLIKKFKFPAESIRRIEVTGVEKLAQIITTIAPLLLLIGIAGIYLEFKTPGMSVFGFIGVTSLLIFFFGHYIAGLSGKEEVLVFFIGLMLIGVELFILPGHVLPGILGGILIFGSLLWAMIDKMPGTPIIPTFPEMRLPLANLAGAFIGATIVIIMLLRLLPKGTSRLGGLVLQTQLAGEDYRTSSSNQSLVGRKGVSLSLLRPSGTARIDDKIVDVITEGEFLPPNQEIVVKEVHGAEIIVRKA